MSMNRESNRVVRFALVAAIVVSWTPGFTTDAFLQPANHRCPRGGLLVGGSQQLWASAADDEVQRVGASAVLTAPTNSGEASNGKEESPPPTVPTARKDPFDEDAMDKLQKEHEAQLAVLQNRLDTFQASLKTYEQKEEENRKKAAATPTGTTTTTTDDDKQVSELSSQLKDAQSKLEQVEAKSAELEIQRNATQDELDELQEIFNTQVKDLVEQYEREAKLRSTEKENAEMKLDQARMDADAKLQEVLDRNIQSVHNAKAKAAEQLVEQEEELAQLRADLKIARSTIRDATVYLQELKTERGSIRKMLKQSWTLLRERAVDRFKSRGGSSIISSGGTLPRRSS